MSWTLAELATWVDGRVVAGDPKLEIRNIAPLDEAGPEELSFLVDRRYLERARSSRAGAILCEPGALTGGITRLEVDNGRQALAVLLERCYPEPEPEWGVHSTAILGSGCTLAQRVAIGPYAVLGRQVRVGEGAVIGSHAVVGDDCEIGAGARIGPHAVVYRRSRIGARVAIYAGSVVGAPGFGYLQVGEGGWRQIPQVGRVELEEDVELGALSAVDRALVGSTRLGRGTKVDNLVQIGHNVQIGAGSLLCGQAGVSGSVRLGAGVVLAGQAGIGGHLRVGDGARIAAKAAVFEDVPPKTDVAGIPARPIGEWRRQVVILRRIGQLWSRLKRLAVEDDRQGG